MKSILSIERNILPYLVLSAIGCCMAMFCPAQTIDFGKTYINLTRGMNGGSVQTGDTIEIRAQIAVRAGTFDSCAYYDAIPSGTAYIPGTIRVLTNEGKLYKQFTDASSDDCGWISGSNIRINLGYNIDNAAMVYRRGRVASSHKPSQYGSACIMLASFRVRVTAALNTNINTGGGTMTYRAGINPIQTFVFPPNMVRVYANPGLCTTITSPNMVSAEFSGTFGVGRPRNRTTGSTYVPVAYVNLPIDIGTPNDYGYSITNNTSTRQNYSTSNNWAKPDLLSPTHRVFNVWDIIGDHTGALAADEGNPAADTAVNANGGYMLLFNSAFRVDSALQLNVSGLCPNTYYEISCWVRNICSKCGCDSNGTGATSSAGPPYYIPTSQFDSSGVYPNLIFEVNGIDYYTSGEIPYTGKWVKKGFSFLTGPSQTNFTLKLFNNAPGGGGNDWALDDVVVTTCSPLMTYAPTSNPIVCYGNPITLYDTVSSYISNLIYYTWQRSTDNGATWNNVTLPLGPVTATWTGAAWQYIVSYTVPITATQLADSADQYRVWMGSTTNNLSGTTCRFTDSSKVLTLNIIDCGIALADQVLSFTGKLINGNAFLQWSSTRENEALLYEIERSKDGYAFEVIGNRNGMFPQGSDLNTYNYSDPMEPGSQYYYRVKISNYNGQVAYTRTIQLSSKDFPFAFTAVVNPFSNQLRFDVSSPGNMRVNVQLFDAAGAIVRRKEFQVSSGVNRLAFENTTDLPAGIFILRVQAGEQVIQKIMVKQHQTPNKIL